MEASGRTSRAQRAHVGLTVAESRPAFAPRPRPAPGAPNVVVVVLDDVGFGQLGCFGSDLATPAIDRLAAGGVRLNRFHVTALCSPTRASVLTGRNHHAIGMGFLPDVPIGFPGYHGRIPRSAAGLPRLLRDAGWSTFAVGKWHLTPRWDLSASGPFDTWPLGLGFERYYGFLGGDTNQYAPELVRDNGFVDPPRGPDEGYHLTEDLADEALRLVQDQQQATPDKPFFLWFATGAMHAPHQVAPEWSEPYRGRFDDGWERWRERVFARQVELGVVPEGTTLTARPPWVAEWDDHPPEQRALFARMMEVYAGFLTHTDAQIGRVVDGLETLGVLDDTVVVLLSDNGASAEGGPHGSLNEHRFTHDLLDDVDDTVRRVDELGGSKAYNHYAWGWAWAGNSPFRLWKRYTWLGGTRTPLVVHWPRGLADSGAIRSQFCHAVDLMPTILDAVGVVVPDDVDGVAQQPVDGESLLPVLRDPVAPSPRATQYFEMLGSRAIVHEGWKATTDHVGRQITVEQERIEGSLDFETDRWSLFRLDDDFSEAHDRAHAEPAVLDALVERWWVEAGRHGVLPLDDTFIGRAGALEPPPWGPRARAVLRPGGGPVAEDVLPPMGAGFTLVADVDVPDATTGGVVAALGDWSNGFALLLVGGRPLLVVNLFGDEHRAQAPDPLAPGTHALGVTYERAAGGGGPVRLVVDGEAAAEARLPRDLPFRWQVAGAGLLVGRDRGLPVCDDYRPPFPFGGEVRTVEIVSHALTPPDAATTLAEALHRE